MKYWHTPSAFMGGGIALVAADVLPLWVLAVLFVAGVCWMRFDRAG